MKKNIFLLFLVFILNACNLDELEVDNVQFSSITQAFPLGTVSYTVRELIDEADISSDELEVGSDSVFFLTFSDEISFNSGDDFVKINDISGGSSFTSDLTTPAATTATTYPLPTFEFVEAYDSEDGEELDSVFYSGGNLTVSVSSDAEVENVFFEITFKNTVGISDRLPIVVSGNVPRSNGTILSTGTGSENLEGFVTILQNDSNTIEIDFDVVFTLASGDQLNGDENLDLEFTYQDQTFSAVFGKFGQDSIEVGNESIDFDFFEDLNGGVFFKEPVIRFNFSSTFGIPLALDFSGLVADDGEGGNQVRLSGSILDEASLPNISAAVEVGEASASIIELNSENSNLRDLFSSTPNRFIFDVAGTSNYYDSTASNFIGSNDSIYAEIEVDIPLDMRLVEFEESFGFDLNDVDGSILDSAFLRIVTSNELPFDGRMFFEIQDAQGNILYTSQEIVLLDAPEIGDDGFVSNINESTNDFSLDSNAIDALELGSRINVVVVLNTIDSQISDDVYVKIRSDYTLDLKVGIWAQINLNNQ